MNIKKTVIILAFMALAAVSALAGEPTDAELNGLTEVQICKKLGPPFTNVMHSAAELYANAEKSSPIAKALADIIKNSPSKNVQIKTLSWHNHRFRMARLVRMEKEWVVFGMEGLPAGWGKEGRESPNQGIQPTK